MAFWPIVIVYSLVNESIHSLWPLEDRQRALTSRETAEQRASRIEAAQTRKIRRLSGWNVFQREHLEGLSLTGDAYKNKVAELGAQWRALHPEDKTRYKIEADYRQSKLDDLARTPLAASNQSQSDGGNLEETVWRNAAKKLSARRLALNVQGFQQHSLWDLPTQLGDSHLECIGVSVAF